MKSIEELVAQVKQSTYPDWNVDIDRFLMEYTTRFLAASQAREGKLRELLPAFRPEFGAVGSRDVDVAQQQKAFDAALALPADDTALQARLKAERERCAKAADDRMGPFNSVAKAIRSMT